MNTTKSFAVSYPGVFLTCLLLASPTAFAGIAGYAQFVNGSVQITDMKGQQRILKKGQAINEGDTLISTKSASAQIRMQDGGFVAVRPDTQLKIDSFKFSGKEDGSERAIFSLIKGGFRSVTGLIGRINKPSYRITTAVATIGIRGTDHETLVVAPGSPLAQASPAGTYNKVNVGETYIATEKGTIFVLPNQMGYAGASDQMPELKPLNTDLFTVASKPTKEAKSEEEDGEEVRETAAVDNTAVETVAPENETISQIATNTQTDIVQPITTTDGANLSGELIVETFAAYIPKNILISMSSGYSIGNFFVDPANIFYTAGSPTAFTQVSFDSGWTESFKLLGASSPINGAAISGATGIQFGRWTSVTGMEQSSSWQLDQQWMWMSSNWMYGPEGYLDPGITLQGGQMSGTFNYILDGNTPPVDFLTGQAGTLTSASLTVDFINSLLSANIGLTIGGLDWSASSSGGITGSKFYASTTAISMGAAGTTLTPCSTCTGYLNGAFTGQNFAGAILSYSLYDSSYTSNISGGASLVRVESVFDGTPAATGNYYVYSGITGINGDIQLADNINFTTSNGLLTSYGWGSASTPDSSYYSVSVSCVTCPSYSTTNTASTGIYYGSWDAGTITQTWGSTFATFGPTWIAGPEAGPLFLANALVGVKTYSFDGGMVTNMSGVAGTVQNTTTLTVDFTRQVVGINLDLSVPDTTTGASHSWNATAESVIQGGQGIGGVDFYASSYNTGGAGLLTVTVDGVPGGSGDLSGQLTGSGFNGAIMSYNLNAMIGTTSYEQVSGVAAFVGASSDIATPRRLVMVSVTEPNLVATSAVHALGFYANSPDRMLTDVSGNLTQFDIDTVANNDSGNANGAMTLNSGTNTLSNAGSDALTGISWGRWDAGSTGSMDVTDRPSSVTTPTPLAGSLHWIAGPTETAAVTLPVSGTYAYTHAGGTTPTDNLGIAGTLNSAKLSANFTAQTVDIGVNVTVAGATMAGLATNVPIIQSTAFYADSTYPQTSSSHLAVTCTGTCGTSAQGAVLGGFTGAGATGAMMSYGFENIGSTSTQVISGVAAFRR